jgi:hypothetical protein
VWVENPRDADRAREVIDAFQRSGTGPPSKCPACGEENPASFDLCWSCGTGLER